MLCDRRGAARWALRLASLLIWSGGFVWFSLSDEGFGWAFTISAPTEEAVLQAGQPVPVAVTLGKDLNLRTVHFYWYRLDEEPLSLRRANPSPFTPAKSGSPLAGTLTVPEEALGVMRLVAVGEVMRGRLESYEEFDEILVTVETAASITAIEFTVEKPWRFDGVGKRTVVPAVGLFDDGILRPLTGPKAGSRFRSSNTQIVSVDPFGGIQVVGAGKAQLVVEHGKKVGTLDVIVEAGEEVNRPPIAELVEELSVRSGDLVVLDGLRSRDPDGDSLRYEWKQIRGHRVALTNVNEAKATFVAPRVSERKAYKFSLIVTDMAGPDSIKGADSAPAVITVWVRP